ncbi:plasmid pRiA4b ORF-3 family protein [Litoribacter alkaliphilus]|uniref:Plasmid pRiA4b ORF-3 family protein n=1 Tax=Litoribacter ruber TaxID=702568 RepID=A0AAP2CKT0_9BACT|nr:plasmid pRiA4b ORF-3 family protein [Litoribacter alkaliphilus]MBS9525524.1 plasmid pRiA4b ORF-3 family protein [Litoribacter alkaliphilus]
MKRGITPQQPIKLKISLEGLPFRVTRKVLVPHNTNLIQLHVVLQYAMGWMGGHLFQFRDRRTYPGVIASYADDPEFFIDEVEETPAHRVKLHSLYNFRQGLPFWYWYDFGYDWWHKVSFLVPSRRDLGLFELFGEQPLCVEAEGKCPPEDVGGVFGFEQFCQVINDPNHEEYQSYRHWLGLDMDAPYDLMQVDVLAINNSLRDFFNSDRWKWESDRFFREGLI